MRMKRKLAILVAVFAMTTATFALPASAGSHIHGEVDITLVEYECPNPNAPGDGFMTWVGTYKVGDRTFGIAYFPAGPLEIIGETGFVYFEESWTLFKLPRFMWHEDALLWAACTPWRILVEGIDAGVGTPDGLAFGAGEVTYGKKHFEKFVGGNAFWYGGYTNDTFTEFESDLWIFRGDMD
jgi:hypothetical protein